MLTIHVASRFENNEKSRWSEKQLGHPCPHTRPPSRPPRRLWKPKWKTCNDANGGGHLPSVPALGSPPSSNLNYHPRSEMIRVPGTCCGNRLGEHTSLQKLRVLPGLAGQHGLHSSSPRSYLDVLGTSNSHTPKTTTSHCPHTCPTSSSGSTFDPESKRGMEAGTRECFLVLLLLSKRVPSLQQHFSSMSPIQGSQLLGIRDCVPDTGLQGSQREQEARNCLSSKPSFTVTVSCTILSSFSNLPQSLPSLKLA